MLSSIRYICLLFDEKPFSFIDKVRKSEELKQILSEENIEDKTRNRLLDKELTPSLVSQQLGHLFNSYTQAFNKKYDRSGSLFERPFERQKVDRQRYFCKLVCYNHRNPQLHNLVDDFRDYRKSSYQTYLSGGETKVNIAGTVEYFGGMESFQKIHSSLAELPEEIKME